MDKKFQGVYAVICTPFTEDDKIDETALRKHLQYLVDQGNVHGIIPTGSTGEFAAMSDQELQQVADITIDEVKGKVPVVVGTAAVATKDTIKRSQYEQISHIKESSGDMTRVAEIMHLCGDNIDIFCGCDTLSMEMFLMGAKGWVAPPANMVPNLCVQLYELAAVQRDIQKARELYFKLLPLLTMFETTGQYVQLTKAGLEILGRPYGNPRRPLLPPTDGDKQRLREILETLVT